MGIWSLKAQSLGDSGDLRKIFPYLVAASKPHFASNTCGQVSYKLKIVESKK